MSYTVGFDLGTHQTKICIQDASNPAEKIYEFLEFLKPDGSSTVLFPSIVQINVDGTLSYGYPDESKALSLDIGKPILSLDEMPKKPVYPQKSKVNYPKKPKEDWKDILRKKNNGEKTLTEIWEEECYKIELKVHKPWDKECRVIDKEYEIKCSEVELENKKRTERYKQELSDWEIGAKSETCRYRYFKLRAFTDEGYWKSDFFDSKEICVWYIAYILLTIKENKKYREPFIENNLSIQFGTPVGGGVGTDTHSKNRNKEITERAFSLYASAFNLARGYNSLNEYLAATYEELRSKTKIERISDEEKNSDYIFDNIPESFAGLVSVTTKGKLKLGFHILVDIGGGTTDMSMFCIDNETYEPDVITLLSFPKGLNYIFEKVQLESSLSLEKLQEKFNKNPKDSIFSKAIANYKKELRDNGTNIVSRLRDSYIQSDYFKNKRSTSFLDNAIKDRPVNYCGGGSLYDILHTKVDKFTDIIKIDKEMLDIRNVRNINIPDKLYAILAVSYGLASYDKELKDIKFTDISVLFQRFNPNPDNNYKKDDYNLIQT